MVYTYIKIYTCYDIYIYYHIYTYYDIYIYMHLLYKYIPLPGVFKLPAHLFSSHPFEKAEELLTALVARTHELPADRCVLDPDGEGRLSWRYPSGLVDRKSENQLIWGSNFRKPPDVKNQELYHLSKLGRGAEIYGT